MSLPTNPYIGQKHTETIRFSNSDLKDLGIITGVAAGFSGSALKKYALKKLEGRVGAAIAGKAILALGIAVEAAALSGYILDHFTDYDGIELHFNFEYKRFTYTKDGISYSWNDWSVPTVSISLY